MRHLVLALMVLSSVAFGLSTKKIDAAVTSIGATYNTTAPQLAVTNVGTTSKNITVFNTTASEIAFHIKHRSAAYAPATTGEINLPASTSIELIDVGISNQIFLRSVSGTISSGTVLFVIW